MYPSRVIKFDFPDLAIPECDPVWVVMKNPAMLPQKMLFPPGGSSAKQVAKATEDISGDDEASVAAAAQAGGEVISRLIIAWHVYAGDGPEPEYDPVTGEETKPAEPPELLPPPSGGNGVPPEHFARLPFRIQMALMERFGTELNPSRGPEDPTQKMSSGRRKASTTGRGAAPQSQPS